MHTSAHMYAHVFAHKSAGVSTYSDLMCTHGIAGPCTGVIPNDFQWIRGLLEGTLFFCVGLAVLITVLEMLKELRKKYLCACVHVVMWACRYAAMGHMSMLAFMLVCSEVHVHAYVCKCACTCACVCMCVRASAHARAHAHAQACVCLCVHLQGKSPFVYLSTKH